MVMYSWLLSWHLILCFLCFKKILYSGIKNCTGWRLYLFWLIHTIPPGQHYILAVVYCTCWNNNNYLIVPHRDKEGVSDGQIILILIRLFQWWSGIIHLHLQTLLSLGNTLEIRFVRLWVKWGSGETRRERLDTFQLTLLTEAQLWWETI